MDKFSQATRRILAFALCAVAATTAFAQVPVTQATMAWGHQTYLYTYNNVCGGGHPIQGLYSPQGVQLGTLNPPTTFGDCALGTWSGQVPASLSWWQILPGPLTLQTFYRTGPGCCSFSVGPNSSTIVYFQHDASIAELRAGVTISTVFPMSSCATRRATYVAPAQATFPAPPGLASPGFIALDSTGCNYTSTGYAFPKNFQSQWIAVEFQDPPGDVWVLDAAASNGGARTWRQLAGNEIHGNIATFLAVGDGAGVSAVVAVKQLLTPGPGVTPVTPIADLWWAGASESGWGLNIASQGDKLFTAAFIYDAAGRPTWLVMSDGTWDATHTNWSGQFYTMHGSPFTRYDATALKAAWAGVGTFNFSNPETATFSFAPAGSTLTKSISRFVFSPDASIGRYAGLWWGGASQDGWGLSVAHQGESVFATWYSYGNDGEPLWFYMPGATKLGDGHYSGPLYKTRGAAWLGASSFDGSQTHASAVGTLDLVFRDGQSGTMSATVDGVKVINEIQRFGF
jgi:hypothetical protein